MSYILGVEDDEILSEITEQGGEFIAELSDLGTSGRICIEVEDSLVGDVAILNGSAKHFEHFLFTRSKNNFKFSNGKK